MIDRRHLAGFAIALFAVGDAKAQSPADRVQADSFIRVVERQSVSTVSVDVDLMHRIEAVFVADVNRHDKWSRAWYGLGLVRLQLARTNILAREGPELPIGMNNESGAEHALMRAVRLDPTFAAAANALALAPTIREGNARLRERVTAGRRGYAVMSGAALASAAFSEREVGSIDSAVALEERALVVGGVDSALVMLPLARDLYRIGATKEGRERLIAAANSHSEIGQRSYRQELAWVASPTELIAWDSLLPSDRPDWVANFWAKRDIAEGRRDGARLEEHYRRIEYAMANFRITLPERGRQKYVSMTPSGADGYEAEDRARRHFVTGQAGALYTQGRFIGSEAISRYYQPIQDLINDKGIIWIRHGPPTQMAHNTRGTPFEIWRYDRSEGPLILYFREADFEASAMPNELVTTLLDVSPVILREICDLDQPLCPMYSVRLNFTGDAAVLEAEVIAEGSRLGLDALSKSSNRGKAFIDLATTTDTYHRDFSRAVHPTVQIFGLDRATGGDPRMVIAFAIPAKELVHETSGGRTVYPVQFQVMAAAARNGQRIEVDTLRRFATTGPLDHSESLTGVIEVPVPSGSYAVSVVLTQADNRGAIAHLGELSVPGGRDVLAVSDLVLGRVNSGVQWNSGTTAVALNPLNTYPAGGDAEVYFQLSGLKAGLAYGMRFELFKSDDDAKRGPRLTITSSQTAAQSRLEVSRTLGLANLDPGTYRVKLTVSGDGRSAIAAAWLTIVK